MDISNNSWGGGGRSQAPEDAIRRADNTGHILIAAAGNGGSDGVGDHNDAAPQYPASYDAGTDRLKYTSPRLAFGRHKVQVVAGDDAGNVITHTWGFKVVR